MGVHLVAPYAAGILFRAENIRLRPVQIVRTVALAPYRGPGSDCVPGKECKDGIQYNRTVSDTPRAVAALKAVDIASPALAAHCVTPIGIGVFAGGRRPKSLTDPGGFNQGELRAREFDQAIAEEMHAILSVGKPPLQPPDQSVNIALVVAMIVMGVGMIGGTDKFPVSTVHAASISSHRVLNFRSMNESLQRLLCGLQCHDMSVPV